MSKKNLIVAAFLVFLGLGGLLVAAGIVRYLLALLARG